MQRDDSDFEIVNFPFLDGDVSRNSSDLLEYLAMLLTSTL